jgi:hypothetical protein
MKQMKKLSVLAIILLFSSCILDNDCIVGSGTKITKEITLPEFTKFESFGANTIIVTQGDIQKVEVTGYPNIINDLETEVRNKTWKMEFQDDECYRNAELTIHITIPKIERADLNGTGKITINNFENNSKDLSLNLSGSGDFELNTTSGTENLDIKIDGSGEIKALGNFTDLENLNIVIKGSGDYDGFPLITDNATINILGSGDCNVFVNSLLDIVIEGSGSINYKGNPTITQSITGSGKLVNAN